jgi:hypothetical protein
MSSVPCDMSGRRTCCGFPLREALLALFSMPGAMLLLPLGCGQGFDVTSPDAVPTNVVLPSADVEVPVTILNSLIFMDVTVNGAGPYKFLLDTGAALGQVSPEISSQFPGNLLNRTTTIVGPLGETAPVPLFRVDSLKIGDTDFQNFAVVVRDVPGMFVGAPFAVDGIVGSGLFRNVLLTLNYPAAKIGVRTGALPAVDDCVIVPITGGDLAGGTYILPQVSIDVQGQTVSAFLDSGNSGSLLLPESFAGSAFSSPPTPVATFTQNGVTVLLQGTLSGDVTLGCVLLDHPIVQVGGNLTSLGAAGWQTYVVTLDQESKRGQFVKM